MKYVFKKMRRMRIYDIATGQHKCTLNDFKTAQFTGSQDIVYAEGTDGARLAAFDTSKVSAFNGTNGTVDTGYIALQVGSDEVIVSGGKGIMLRAELTTTDGTAVTLPYIATGTTGNEIGFIYATDANGMPGASYAQGATASSTVFSYAPSTGVITLPTGVFAIGDTVFVDYYPEFSTYTLIDNDADKFSIAGKVIIDAWFTDLCTNADVLLQVVMDKGKISGEIDLSFGDQAAVQNVAVEAMSSVCSGEAKNLWHLYVYDEDNAVGVEVGD